VGLVSEPGEPKAGAQELTGALRRALLLPRVPVAPPRIGSPKGSPKGSTDPNDPEGAPQNPADPHPGQSSNPADQSHPGAPPRIASGDQAGPSTQGEGNTPARIASDKPNEPAGTTPESLLMGQSKDFNTLPPKGRQLDDDVHRAIRDNEPNVRLPKLTDNYEVRGEETGLVLHNAKDLEGPFRDIGVDITKAKYTSARIYSKTGPEKKGQAHSPVVGGRYFDQDRTIVAEDLFAPNDKNPQDKKMKVSNIVFVQWEKYASHKKANGEMKPRMSDDVDQLENFVARNIQSRSTVETIETAHRKTSQPLSEKGIFRRGGEGAQKESFEALLYTDIVASVQHMLRQHHGELGNKRIAEVITYPRTFDPKTKQGEQRTTMTLRFETWRP